MATSGSSIPPEHGLGVEVNVPGWVVLYTLDGEERMVREDRVDQAMAGGLVAKKFDIDAAKAEWDAAMRGAMDAVPKAIAEMVASGYQRDEDAWIVNDAMLKVRDSFAQLMQSAAVVLPTEATIAALRESPAGPEHDKIQALMEKYGEAVKNYPAERLAARQAKTAADAAQQAAERS